MKDLLTLCMGFLVQATITSQASNGEPANAQNAFALWLIVSLLYISRGVVDISIERPA